MSIRLFWREIRDNIGDGLSTVQDVRFEPDSDTFVAILSVVCLWGIYYFQSTSESVESIVLFLLVGNLALTILFPLYYVCYVRNEPLSEVGITKEGWKRAVVVSTVGALVLAPGLLFVDESAVVLVPHILTVGLMLWEPLFVHGFLQIRFERAFGPVLGIVFASGGFVLFHIGAVAPAGLVMLGLIGLFHAILFCACNRNLLVLWPILWAVGSSQGTIDSVVFGWEEASAYVGILLIAGVALYATAKTTSTNNGNLQT